MIKVGKQYGPFTIEKELGAGAMGSVYLGRVTETGQRVAIKIIAPGLAANETAMKRFKREAAILKQLSHPNIVHLVVAGKFGGTPFYAMEYVEGESLDHVMARRGRISWEEVVILGGQLCAALKHAHDNGIIHRDLKPSNVMVLPDDTLKLTDFGIAKDMDETALTSANCTVGTAAYMSPEQCQGKRDLTLKSDLYSLGIMFYELVTGRKPFRAENPMDMFMLHVQGTFERPSRLVLDIPVWLDNLICQLLEKKPEQRPYDAATVADTLGRIKEKVEAQRSAGIDIVKSRSDRPRLDDEDKEAARTLLGKKKKKKKGRPFYQQIWFKAVLYSALLVVVVAVFYVLVLKRPSADALFKRAKDWVDKGELAEKVEQRKDGDIAQFLRYYPEDPRAKQVQQWVDEIDREKAETDLVGRYRRDVTLGVDEDEKQARLAIEKEEAGKLEAAEQNWKGFLKYKDSAEPEKHGYALVAQRRLQTLKEVKDEEIRLSSHIFKDARAVTFKPSGKEEEAAADAFQQEENDRAKGRAAWKEIEKRLKDERDKDDLRLWYLLAAKHLLDLAEPPAEKKQGAFRQRRRTEAFALRVAGAQEVSPRVAARGLWSRLSQAAAVSGGFASLAWSRSSMSPTVPSFSRSCCDSRMRKRRSICETMLTTSTESSPRPSRRFALSSRSAYFSPVSASSNSISVSRIV